MLFYRFLVLLTIAAMIGALLVARLTPPLSSSTAISVAPVAPTPRGPRGYLTTPQELGAIQQKASAGIAPYAANVRELLALDHLSSANGWIDEGSIGGDQRCSDGSQEDENGDPIPRGPRYLVDGSRLAYAKMVVALLSPAPRAEAYARDVRARLLDLLDTSGWGGSDYSVNNQCILYLNWYIPSFVMAADLLDSFPQIWSAQDKQQFQQWLAREVYPKVAWASRARVNNWGSTGSYAAALLADYLGDAGVLLTEEAPVRRQLSPGAAYVEHTQEQLKRMSTEVAPRDKTSSRCLPLKGIQPHGGIPDELRRAKIPNQLEMCKASYLPSITGGYGASYIYQITHVEALIAHAELALRRGDRTLYEQRASDGSGSILQAIKFIIANPVKPEASYDWDEYRMAQLYVAYRYYRDPAIARQLKKSSTLRSGEFVIFARVTHDFGGSETVGPPPTTPARKP